jgi:hypothetical protein
MKGVFLGRIKSEFRLPGLARRLSSWVEGPPRTTCLLPSQRCLNFNLARRTEYQKRGIRRIFHGGRNLLHLRGDCVVKICPEASGKLGVFSGVSHIFRHRCLLASFSWFLHSHIKSLLSLCCYYTVTRTILKVHIW